MRSRASAARHGSQFELATGAVKAGPARDPIQAYQVEPIANELVISGFSRRP